MFGRADWLFLFSGKKDDSQWWSLRDHLSVSQVWIDVIEWHRELFWSNFCLNFDQIICLSAVPIEWEGLGPIFIQLSNF